VAGIAGDSVLYIRQQSRVYAVQSVGIKWQSLPNVREALRFGLFKFVEIGHNDVRC